MYSSSTCISLSSLVMRSSFLPLLPHNLLDDFDGALVVAPGGLLGDPYPLGRLLEGEPLDRVQDEDLAVLVVRHSSQDVPYQVRTGEPFDGGPRLRVHRQAHPLALFRPVLPLLDAVGYPGALTPEVFLLLFFIGPLHVYPHAMTLLDLSNGLDDRP